MPPTTIYRAVTLYLKLFTYYLHCIRYYKVHTEHVVICKYQTILYSKELEHPWILVSKVGGILESILCRSREIPEQTFPGLASGAHILKLEQTFLT